MQVAKSWANAKPLTVARNDQHGFCKPSVFDAANNAQSNYNTWSKSLSSTSNNLVNINGLGSFIAPVPVVIPKLPGVPGVSVNSVAVTMKLSVDLSSIPDINQFKQNFAADIAISLNISASSIGSVTVTAGSVLVSFSMNLPGIAASNALTSLATQMADPSSVLRQGSITSSTDSSFGLQAAYVFTCPDGMTHVSDPCTCPGVVCMSSTGTTGTTSTSGTTSSSGTTGSTTSSTGGSLSPNSGPTQSLSIFIYGAIVFMACLCVYIF